MSRRDVFVDTSALYALFCATDSYHQTAVDALAQLSAESAALFTARTTLHESYTLIHARLGRENLIRFHASVGQSQWLQVLDVPPDWEAAAWSLLEQQSDKNYSLVDAIAFAAMSALDTHRAFAFDRHFQQAGFELVHT